jgi:hypothetical protein
MPDYKDPSHTLHKTSQIVEALDDTSQKILQVMEEQIEAVISSDSIKIEQLSETHNSLKKEFKRYESAFIQELEYVVSPLTEEDEVVSLKKLKRRFPGSASDIDQWRKCLAFNVKKLQQKHEQIIQLLELALVQNSKMMQSIYGLHSDTNTHYNPSGGKTGVVSGLAVNQEA